MNEKDIPGIVEVQWIDSVILNYGEWTDRDEAQQSLELKALYHRTTGYLIDESDHAILVASSINDQEDSPTHRIAGGIVIPKCAIVKTDVLRAHD